MQNEPNPNDLQNLWQDQEIEKVTITIDEVRRRANRFERRIHWRNLREYGVGMIVFAFLAAQLLRAHGWHLAPPLLLIAGTLYVMYQLYLRGARPVPSDAGVRASLEFHRLELERQRDALRSVWRWYLLPFVPGFVATLVMAGWERGINVRLIISVLIIVLVLIGTWGLNQWAARKLDLKIQELKGMEANDV